jgi:hypothetical protein
MTNSTQIIDKLFHDWTYGLDPLAARIKVYRLIRDIPYAVIPSLIDSKKYLDILKLGRGSCTPKHFLLAEMFQRLGLLTLFTVYPFKWGERAEVFVDYPEKLRDLATRQPLGHHLACKVEIDGKMVVVDATLDLPLSKLELLPVNKDWDGFSDTLLPMTPVGEEIVFHPIEAHRMQARVDTSSLAFYDELNKTLESIRNA